MTQRMGVGVAVVVTVLAKAAELHTAPANKAAVEYLTTYCFKFVP